MDKSQTTTETAWLIERQDPKNLGCVMLDSFLGVRCQTNTTTPNGQLDWLPSVQWALRFARKQDAETFINMWMLLSENLPHRDTLVGFRVGDPRPIAVEHQWG